MQPELPPTFVDGAPPLCRPESTVWMHLQSCDDIPGCPRPPHGRVLALGAIIGAPRHCCWGCRELHKQRTLLPKAAGNEADAPSHLQQRTPSSSDSPPNLADAIFELSSRRLKSCSRCVAARAQTRSKHLHAIAAASHVSPQSAGGPTLGFCALRGQAPSASMYRAECKQRSA